MAVSAKTDCGREMLAKPDREGSTWTVCSSSRPLFISAVVITLISGCSSRAIAPSSNGLESAADTTVHLVDVNAHLNNFNGVEADGRATGTRGFARAADYASRRFSSYGLQPVVQGEFSTFYGTSINYPRSAELRISGTDSLRLNSATGIVPDGRSVSDTLGFSTVIYRPGPTRDVTGRVISVTASDASDTVLRAYVDRGVRAVLIEGPLEIRPFSNVISHLVAVRIHPEELQLFLNSSRPGPNEEVRLSGAAELRIITESWSNASAINLMAMLPGADPVLRNELVIIGARLDGFGSVFGRQLTDGSDLAVGAAALLEAARMLAERQDWSHLLKRTVMVVLWSGSMQENAGLKWFLLHPPWASGAIRVLILAPDQLESEHPYQQLVTGGGYRYVAAETTEWMTRGTFQPREDVFSSTVRREAIPEVGRLATKIVEMTIRESR